MSSRLPFLFVFVIFLWQTGAATVALKGVSESCAEFGQALPGEVNKDYTWPEESSIKHFARAGFGVIRVPFLWERLQPALNGAFDTTYLGSLNRTISQITAANMSAVLDPHNYARYSKSGTVSGGEVIGAPGSSVSVSDFVDGFWGRLAAQFAPCKRCIFAIMNEPNTMSTGLWASIAQKAINAIRAAGATEQLVLVPGNGWTGAHSWMESWPDSSSTKVSNAQAFENFTDPAGNWAFEMHQYLDSDFSGTNPQCKSADVGVEALTDVTAWLEKKAYKAWLGEFAGGANDVCEHGINNMLAYMDKHSGAWIGWSWWAAGPWWHNSWSSIEPNADGSDKPQVAWLSAHIAPTPTPAPPTPSPPHPPAPTPPAPSGCPGGSLSACIALCPSNPAPVYSACVKTCSTRCAELLEGALLPFITGQWQ